MNNLDPSPFEQCALASGLLTRQQLDTARATVRWSEGDEPEPVGPPSDQELADRLIEMGLLNAWQAKQLLDGRTKFNLGPYLIIDSIGQGGMGQVFKAQHENMGRIVAVKVLPRDKATPETVANFTREIRALSSLDHPKLVAALDAGEDGNVHYLVTEYVSGMDLRKLVRRDGPLDMAAAASIVSQVAEALEYAHAQGIIHRDVKPGNVLVSPDGEAKLSDLGLSGPLVGQPKTDPRHGKIAGTADYLSPDQIRDPWSPSPGWDIYSLGCTLYYAVTGKVPFPGGTTADKARAHCDLRPLDPQRLNPQLSPALVDVIADMMAKEPAQRIASARVVIERLAPFMSSPAVTAPPVVARRVGTPPTAPPYVVPPPVVRPRRWTSNAPLADTITDLPVAPADPASSSGKGIKTFGTTPGDEDDSVSLEIPVQSDSAAVLWPLTAFVLAPLALVGAVFLLWMLVRAIFS